MSKSDSDLLEAFKSTGDEDAFRDFARRYMGLIYRAALRRSGSPELAEEAAQNTLCLCVKKIATSGAKPPAHLAAWLHRTATYEAANLLKKELRHRKRIKRLMQDPSQQTSAEDPPTWEEALPHLDASLDRLSETDRELLILHYFQKKPHREIARMVGKSESAVQRQCHRCLKKLARLLKTRGVVLSGTALTTLLVNESAKTVPSLLFTRLPTIALLTPGTSSLPIISKTLLLMTTKQSAIATGIAVAVVCCIPIVFQQAKIGRLQRENVAFEQALNSKFNLPTIMKNGNQASADNTVLKPWPKQGWPSSPRQAVENALASFRGAELDERLAEGGAYYAGKGRKALEEYCLALRELTDNPGFSTRIEMGRLLAKLAFVAAEKSGNAGEGELAVDQFVKALAAVNGQSAKELVARIGPPYKGRAHAALVGGLSTENPNDAITYLRSLSTSDLADGLNDLEALGRMAAHDPVAVATLIDRLPMNNEAASRYERVAAAWAATEPLEALAWAGGLEFEAVRTSTLSALYQEWTVLDRDRAFAELERIEDDSFRRGVFGKMAAKVFDHATHGEAEDWTRSLEGGNRTYALGLLASHTGERDPELAIQLHREALEGAKDDRTPLGEPTARLGSSYAAHDPVAASQWATDFTDWWIKGPAVAGVADKWAETDPVAASEWIATLPDGSVRNNAVYNLVRNIRDADPSSAFDWAATITGDDDKRLYLLKQAVDSWTKFAPDETRTAIDNLSIPENEKFQLQRRLRSGPE